MMLSSTNLETASPYNFFRVKNRNSASLSLYSSSTNRKTITDLMTLIIAYGDNLRSLL